MRPAEERSTLRVLAPRTVLLLDRSEFRSRAVTRWLEGRGHTLKRADRNDLLMLAMGDTIGLIVVDGDDAEAERTLRAWPREIRAMPPVLRFGGRNSGAVEGRTANIDGAFAESAFVAAVQWLLRPAPAQDR
jgi:hypothetical protein